MEGLIKIKDVSDKCDITARTLRYYDKKMACVPRS